jgi:hypothetical protein
MVIFWYLKIRGALAHEYKPKPKWTQELGFLSSSFLRKSARALCPINEICHAERQPGEVQS